MTDMTIRPILPRPAPAPDRGPLDDRFYDLVEARFARLVRDNPVFGTAMGLHQDDDLLGDGSRDAVLGELAADRDHLARIEALDPAGLSSEVRFERDLELHNLRRVIFDADVLRLWERRSLALDTIGDGLFLLFARDHAPLAERLSAISGRLEAVGTYLEEAKTRATVPQVRRWQQLELESAAEMPAFFDEIVAAGRDVLDASEQSPARSRRRDGQGRASSSMGRGSREPSRPGPTNGRSAASDTTRWSRCGPSTGWTPTPSWSSAGSACARSVPRGRPPRARSIRTPTRRPSSTASSRTSPRISTVRWRPIEMPWPAPASS